MQHELIAGCSGGVWGSAPVKKISPVWQCELWRGLALPSEDIFLDGSSAGNWLLAGREEKEDISGLNSELGLTARYFRPE